MHYPDTGENHTEQEPTMNTNRIHTTAAAVAQMAAANHVTARRTPFFASVVLGGVVYWAAA